MKHWNHIFKTKRIYKDPFIWGPRTVIQADLMQHCVSKKERCHDEWTVKKPAYNLQHGVDSEYGSICAK